MNRTKKKLSILVKRVVPDVDDTTSGYLCMNNGDIDKNLRIRLVVERHLHLTQGGKRKGPHVWTTCSDHRSINNESRRRVGYNGY